jgi:hypothetical protein
MTLPWFAQLPVWIWAGCMLLGANPTSETFTVNACVPGSQLRSAVPLGRCFKVMVVLMEGIVGAVVGVEAGGDELGVDELDGALVLPPHAARSNTVTMHSAASA